MKASPLDVKAAAKALNVSKSFLDRLRVRGDGPPYFKLGKKVAYDATELQAWFTTRRRSSTSDAEAA